ncbi:MAG: ribosome assembly factor SBDS [Candidatus Woesearchaeota archaeon]
MVKGNKLIDNRIQISVNLVRYKSHGKVFEIAIDPDKAIDYKAGKDVDVSEIIEADDIFTDMKKGLFASPEDLEEVFKTEDAVSIAKIMLDKGEIQFTQKYRQQLYEKKRNKIINLIHRNVIDPRSKLPHPINRIEAAMEEAKIKINETESAEAQVKKIIQLLQPIIPMSIEEVVFSVHVPMHYINKIHKIIKDESTIIREQWLGDEGAIFTIKIGAGRSQDFIGRLNSLTHASVNVEKITKEEK